MGLDSPHGHHPEKGLNLHGEDLAALVSCSSGAAAGGHTVEAC
jgi:hypothetical protein